MKGHCLCGRVSVEFEPLRDELTVCHCDTCRRWAGAVLMEIDARAGSVRYVGPVKSYASSTWGERAWCDNCGSTLWYKTTVSGHESYGISAGLVDDAGGLELKREYYFDVKPDGYGFAGEHTMHAKAEMEARLASFLARAGR